MTSCKKKKGDDWLKLQGLRTNSTLLASTVGGIGCAYLVTLVALYLCPHALPADDAQQLPALLLDEVDAVNRLHAAADGDVGRGAHSKPGDKHGDTSAAAGVTCASKVSSELCCLPPKSPSLSAPGTTLKDPTTERKREQYRHHALAHRRFWCEWVLSAAYACRRTVGSYNAWGQDERSLQAVLGGCSTYTRCTNLLYKAAQKRAQQRCKRGQRPNPSRLTAEAPDR